MDDQEKATAEAMILLNMQVEERVLEALANVLVRGQSLQGRIKSATPEGLLRGAVSAMIIDVMRSPEFMSTLWQELVNHVAKKAEARGPITTQTAGTLYRVNHPEADPYGLVWTSKT
jgi:hypothetical protein